MVRCSFHEVCDKNHSFSQGLKSLQNKISSHHFALLSVCSFQDDPIAIVDYPRIRNPHLLELFMFCSPWWPTPHRFFSIVLPSVIMGWSSSQQSISPYKRAGMMIFLQWIVVTWGHDSVGGRFPAPPGMVLKPVVNDGMNYRSLNWCLPDFWTINGTIVKKVVFQSFL